jgi:hypothetical protein
MSRRTAIRTAAASVAAAITGGAAASAAPSLTPLYRLEGGAWVRRRMFDLQPGDLFTLVDPGNRWVHGKVQRAGERPTHDGKTWTVLAETRAEFARSAPPVPSGPSA